MCKPDKPVTRRLTKDERRQRMIHALKELAERLGPEISMRQFYRETGICDTNVYLLFENWADLRVQAGLPPKITRHGRSVDYTRQQLLGLVRQAAEKYGEGISLSEFTRETGVSPKPVN